ncbi:MAG: helix-turn-helix transcriptional regulator [Actinomycetota bacterium]
MSKTRTERLLNLVICLLATRQYLTKQQIRRAVPGYADGSDEAFERMFERDKEDLREAGIPVETGRNGVFDDEVGYRISPAQYALPELSLEPDEAAVLALAARAWQQANLAAAATGALRKLQAGGAAVGEVTLVDVEPRVTPAGPAFDPLRQAVGERQPVCFEYQAPTAPAPVTRRLEPWGLVSWHGHWYVAGRDRDRQDRRVFRLDRITGPVRADGPAGTVQLPEDVDVAAVVRRSATEEPTSLARLRVRAGAATPLRQQARECAADPQVPGWDLLTVPYGAPEKLAATVASFGSDVVVLDPPQVRDAIVAHLSAAAGEVNR